VVDEKAVRDQGGGKPAVVECAPVRFADRGDLAVEGAVASEDLAARIPERCRFE
jgi:hypothetical protein